MVFFEAEQCFVKIIDNLQTETSITRPLDSLEECITNDVRKLACTLLQEHINSIGIGDIGRMIVSATGEELTHKRILEKTIYTVFGEVKLKRVGYSNRNHGNLCPSDLYLNLPVCSFSYGLQKMLVREVIKSSFEEGLEAVKNSTKINIGKRQAIEIIDRCAQDFDSFYESRLSVLTQDESNSAPIMVLTTDGKGIIMRTDSLREETKKRSQKAEKKLNSRLSKGEKPNRKRMAQVASIYFIDRFVRKPEDVVNGKLRNKVNQRRPRPVAKRIWASVEKDALMVIQEMFNEACKRDSERKKEWVVLIDGQKSQLKAINKEAINHNTTITVISDIVHVIEYLWKASRQFFDESSRECEDWVQDKLLRILNGKSSKVAGSIRMMSAKRRLSDEEKKVSETCANYLAKNASYMNYHEYLSQGYPIGTGVIEGTCRYLIKDRMDITGARWGLSGAEAVLKLRSIIKSGDFEDYWMFHLKQNFCRNYEVNYSDIDLVRKQLSS